MIASLPKRMNFSLPVRSVCRGRVAVTSDKRTHVCQVDVLAFVAVFDNTPAYGYYVCRRADNGAPIFALEDELSYLQ